MMFMRLPWGVPTLFGRRRGRRPGAPQMWATRPEVIRITKKPVKISDFSTTYATDFAEIPRRMRHFFAI